MGNGLEEGRNYLEYLRTNKKTNVTIRELARQREVGCSRIKV